MIVMTLYILVPLLRYCLKKNLSGAKSPPKVRVFKKVALKSRIPTFPQLKKSHPAGDKGDRGFSTFKKSHPAGDKVKVPASAALGVRARQRSPRLASCG